MEILKDIERYIDGRDLTDDEVYAISVLLAELTLANIRIVIKCDEHEDVITGFTPEEVEEELVKCLEKLIENIGNTKEAEKDAKV